MSLQSFFLRRQIKAHPRTRQYVSWDEVRRVLLLTDAAHTGVDEAVKIADMVRKEGKEVEAYYYMDRAEQSLTVPATLRVLTRRETNVVRKPKTNPLQGRGAFDVVIDLSCRQCVPLCYMAVWADAKLWCGCPTDDKTLIEYDFRIMLPEEKGCEASYIAEQIVRYLKMIKSGRRE